ncbi:hypothetical protein MMC28_003958 [Mycoblastus sanguinarius]|nr:hypothetical protein [Mycoblastus sanguinarius]
MSSSQSTTNQIPSSTGTTTLADENKDRKGTKPDRKTEHVDSKPEPTPPPRPVLSPVQEGLKDPSRLSLDTKTTPHKWNT